MLHKPTPDEQLIIKMFIHTFSEYQHNKLQLRIPAPDVRKFLAPYGITFHYFNKLTSCIGRTTQNRYAYCLPILYSLAEPVDESEPKFHKNPFVSKIKTVSYYGGKRRWPEEYALLMTYAHDNFGCEKFIDCFGGSGFLSLLASKLNLFQSIILNDASPIVCNYHSVLKDKYLFADFINRIAHTPALNRDAYFLLRSTLFDGSMPTNSSGNTKRRKFQSVDLENALSFYLTQHYAFNAQGGFSSTKVAPHYHVPALNDTHKLYANIVVSNLYYKKLLLSELWNSHSLIILDPPYLKDLRIQKVSYDIEFSFRKHRSMMQLLSGEDFSAKVIICGYKDDDTELDLYSRYLLRAPVPWHCYRFCKSSSMNVEKSKEHIWCNFDLSDILEQYPDLFEPVF